MDRRGGGRDEAIEIVDGRAQSDGSAIVETVGVRLWLVRRNFDTCETRGIYLLSRSGGGTEEGDFCFLSGWIVCAPREQMTQICRCKGYLTILNTCCSSSSTA